MPIQMEYKKVRKIGEVEWKRSAKKENKLLRLMLQNAFENNITDTSARQNAVHKSQIKSRKERGCRLIPVKSRSKKRRLLPKMSDMTTLQVILHVETVLTDLAELTGNTACSDSAKRASRAHR